jgi:hypothetical protein
VYVVFTLCGILGGLQGDKYRLAKGVSLPNVILSSATATTFTDVNDLVKEMWQLGGEYCSKVLHVEAEDNLKQLFVDYIGMGGLCCKLYRVLTFDAWLTCFLCRFLSSLRYLIGDHRVQGKHGGLG